MKIIKRYANRKLYDTESSSYITLQDVAQMVREGVEFQIVDNRTKKDLTSLTLAQILCEQEKQAQPILPLQALRSIIRYGGTLLERRVVGPISDMKGRTQETVDRLMGRHQGEAPEPYGKEGRSTGNWREVLEQLTRHVDEAVRKVEDQVRRVMDMVTGLPDLQGEIEELEARILRMEERVMELEAMMSGRREPEE